MFSFEPLMFAGLILVSASNVQCEVPKSPFIDIVPNFEQVRYDYSQSEKVLSSKTSNTVSPYDPGVESVTHGLREDRPLVRTHVRIGVEEYTDHGIGCFWYDNIKVEINMSPTIYIAKEVEEGVCKDAIMEHEHKHVKLDRIIMNKYAYEIGHAVKESVDAAGAMGPYNMANVKDIQAMLIDHVSRAVNSKDLELYKEMRALQSAVDSTSEYMRISKICHSQKK